MAEVTILIEGYAKRTENGWVASSTVCLIRVGEVKIITDPGCNRVKLLEELKKEGIDTGEIDYVFLSHQHPDHILLAGIFENAKAITFDSHLLYDGDSLVNFNFNILGSEVEILDTPGHVLEHISIVVKTEIGNVGIAGDCIWWLDDEVQKFTLEQIDHSQAKGMDMEMLINSREKLISKSDYIIPGHGKMFKLSK